MIERVALATCSSTPCICKNKAGFEGMPCLERGRRGVEAMRIPTDAMVKAGTVGWDALDGSPIRPMFAPTPAYTAMIDAALKP